MNDIPGTEQSPPAAVDGLYFDGRSSRQHRVTLSVREQTAVLTGDVQRQCALSELRVSERFSRASRKVTFPDGAYLEVADTAAFNALLDTTGHRESPVARAQQHWRAALIALAATIVLLVLAYLYLLPAVSAFVANRLPPSIERRIGASALGFLDQHVFEPSQLPPARQDALVKRFTALQLPPGPVSSYRILFRKSRIGANALTLPSGEIILTDELVNLLDNDEAVMGVLAHEMGHVQKRHLMQRAIQGSVIGATVTVLFGDVSTLAANLSTLMLDMHYSRDAEREADDYAIATFKANGIPLSQLAYVFQKLGARGGTGPVPFLASHPAGSERIAHILNSR
ncbi:MAG: Zn-dependent protease with chaperone function transrane protein [Herbaspirillum sp.]|nr:Zn-dependent protease with chaperone function transrane protein [Herbaspirillum sp.]